MEQRENFNRRTKKQNKTEMVFQKVGAGIRAKQMRLPGRDF